MVEDTAELRLGDQTPRASDHRGERGRAGHRYHAPAGREWPRHPRPGLRQHRGRAQRDHLRRRREGHPPLPRHPDRGAGREERLPRSRVPADLRPPAVEERVRVLHGVDPRPHDAARGLQGAFFGALPKDAHPMAACSAAVGALSTFYPDSLDPRDDAPGRDLDPPADREAADDRRLRLQALLRGSPSCYPRNDLNYVANFMWHAVRATPARSTRSTRSSARRSTCCSSCTRTTSRTARPAACGSWARRVVNLFSAIAAGINALWGPLHGGANQQVIEMLEQIRDEGMTGRQFVERAKSKRRHLAADGLRAPRLQELRSAR